MSWRCVRFGGCLPGHLYLKDAGRRCPWRWIYGRVDKPDPLQSALINMVTLRDIFSTQKNMNRLPKFSKIVRETWRGGSSMTTLRIRNARYLFEVGVLPFVYTVFDILDYEIKL